MPSVGFEPTTNGLCLPATPFDAPFGFVVWTFSSPPRRVCCQVSTPFPTWIGTWLGITVCRNGVAADGLDRAKLAAQMQEREIEVLADLGLGQGAATILTNDLSHAYIDENMRTS